ncbi:MAG: hypothetical protein ACR2PA_23460 [Hyphomicrobiaceae bacterium]
MTLWVVCIGISVGLLALTAQGRSTDINMAYYNLVVAAAASLVFCILALRSNGNLQARKAGRSAVAADLARSMSLIWLWGVLGLTAIYATGILVWKEWWHFLLAFMAAGALCYASAYALQRQAERGGDDERLLSRGHYATIAQLVGMVVVVVGLLVDGKMVRFFTERYTDWAGNNVFFFGALALGVLCIYGILTRRQPQSE